MAKQYCAQIKHVEEFIQRISKLSICPEMTRQLGNYLAVLRQVREDPKIYTVSDIARLLFRFTNKAIHVENYPTPKVLIHYLGMFFEYLHSYIVKFNSVRKKREQDVDAYHRLCTQWFVQSTPCFELLFEQIIILTENLQEKTEEKIDPRHIDFVAVLARPEFRHLEKAFRKNLRYLTGELFFIRLTRNFQIFLCRLFDGLCKPSKLGQLAEIERAYNLENFYAYLVAGKYGEFKELEDVDFPDELEAKLTVYDIHFENGIDYDLYKLCCED